MGIPGTNYSVTSLTGASITGDRGISFLVSSFSIQITLAKPGNWPKRGMGNVIWLRLGIFSQILTTLTGEFITQIEVNIF